MRDAAAAALGEMLAGAVDDDVAHGSRRIGEEVAPVVEAQLGTARQRRWMASLAWRPELALIALLVLAWRTPSTHFQRLDAGTFA